MPKMSSQVDDDYNEEGENMEIYQETKVVDVETIVELAPTPKKK